MILLCDRSFGALPRRSGLLWLVLAGWLLEGCATLEPAAPLHPTAGDVGSAPASSAAPREVPQGGAEPAPATSPLDGSAGEAKGSDTSELAGDDGPPTEACTDCSEASDEAPDDGEAEPHVLADPGDQSVRYSQDLSDAELERRFVSDLPSLGSISMGFTDEGRLINGVQMPAGETWQVNAPALAYGTEETIQALEAVAEAVHASVPTAGRLRVNHLSKKNGGWARPHRSHQSGRDVDLGLFYAGGGVPARTRVPREKLIDPAANWALVRALVTSTDVQLILVDRRIQKVIYDHALAAGEDRAWLDSLFRGAGSLIRHARGHRDHLHVRFYNPRAQELGRRVQPLLAKRPDENVMQVRVRKGDTLGHIALRHGSSVAAIRKANRLKGSALRVSQVLLVPLRGPCTRCPLPAPVIVPPRRLPPEGGKPVAAPSTEGAGTPAPTGETESATSPNPS